jgi:excinuclease ABC subunit A
MAQDFIRVRGARQHNLKNVDVDIPRNRLVVMTGVSGSGKSSLAFDTLYAEGQRRYVQSLSAYARQFLDQLEKPDVDFIEGLSPAVAIEQRHGSPNPRSTIATVTEIYDYLRVLYAVAGKPHDPETGAVLVRNTTAEIGERLMQMPDGSRVVVLAPVVREEVGDLRALLEKLRRQGFIRVRMDGVMLELDEGLNPSRSEPHSVEVVVDRLVIREGAKARLMDSIETALKWNGQLIEFLIGKEGEEEKLSFTTSYANPKTGYVMEKLTPQHFSFNTHVGACPTCEGMGSVMMPDPGLMVPDEEKSIADGAIKTWWARQPKLKALHLKGFLALAKHFKADVAAPFKKLPADFKKALFQGTGDVAIATGWKTADNVKSLAKPYEGLVPELERLYLRADSEGFRAQLTRFMNHQVCRVCEGKRLRPVSLAVKLSSGAAELNIHDLCALSIRDAAVWVEGLELTAHEKQYCGELQREIGKRLEFLNQVGLGYLALNRESGTLSGGETQRIRLATQIGAGLAGVLYVLDEPSIGLHPADNERLIGTLLRLRDLGNTVLVVEHDEAMMRAADHLIEMGRGAGPQGGQVVAEGTLQEVKSNRASLTGDYLASRLSIAVPKVRVSPPVMLPGEVSSGIGWLTVNEAQENNLKKVTASFPMGCFTCVTGPSGSGKSTLVDDILMRALMRHFYGAKQEPGKHESLSGLHGIDKVVIIDQSPIGRSPRSNPATFTGAFGPIRELYAKLPLARVRGFDSGRFSFNTPGGRCEKCEGDGVIKIDMHFLSDVYVTCEHCHGKRYNAETLEVAFKGRNIAEVLEMTVSEAAQFFGKSSAIYPKLRALEDTGLGYIKLGQSGASLSGGEAQRVKLAAELGKRATGHTLYVFDEPTTGLHFADIQALMSVFMKLRDAGNTLIVIEHNLDVIKCADWVIDLGPGGGEEGGRIVATGTPEAVAAAAESLTGRFLKEHLR